MFRFLFRYIQGSVRIRVMGGFTEKFLNSLGQRNINMTDIHMDGSDYVMTIGVKDFFKIRKIVRRTRIKVIVEEKSGLPFCINKYRKRIFLWFGFPLFLIIIFFLSRIVWDIDISGNKKYSDETIVRYLKTKNVRRGIYIDKVDCQMLTREMRKDFSDIIWVTVYIEGTRCCINIKENEHPETSQDIESTDFYATNIVSDRDCNIRSMIVRHGVSELKAGNQVKKGEVLVSGAIPIMDDSGNIVSYRYVVSDADILGETEILYKEGIDLICDEKKYVRFRRYHFYLRHHGYKWHLGIKKSRKKTEEICTIERKIRFLDILGTDCYWGIEERRSYSIKGRPYSDDEIQNILTERFSLYLRDLKKKNVEILQNNVKIYKGSTQAWAYGKIKALCLVGEQIPIQTTGDNQ